MSATAVKEYVYTGDVAQSLNVPGVGEVKVVPARKGVKDLEDVDATVLSDWQVVPPEGGRKKWYLAGQPDWKKAGK